MALLLALQAAVGQTDSLDWSAIAEQLDVDYSAENLNADLFEVGGVLTATLGLSVRYRYEQHQDRGTLNHWIGINGKTLKLQLLSRNWQSQTSVTKETAYTVSYQSASTPWKVWSGRLKPRFGSGLMWSPASRTSGSGLAKAFQSPHQQIRLPSNPSPYNSISGVAAARTWDRGALQVFVSPSKGLGILGWARSGDSVDLFLGALGTGAGRRMTLDLRGSGSRAILHYAYTVSLTVDERGKTRSQLGFRFLRGGMRWQAGVYRYAADKGPEHYQGLGMWTNTEAGESGWLQELRLRLAKGVRLEIYAQAGQRLEPASLADQFSRSRVGGGMYLRRGTEEWQLRYQVQTRSVTSYEEWYPISRPKYLRRYDLTRKRYSKSLLSKYHQGLQIREFNGQFGWVYDTYAQLRPGFGWAISLGMSRYHIPDFDLRSYRFEPTIQNAFAIQTFSGNRQRLFILFSRELSVTNRVELKLARITDYQGLAVHYEGAIQMAIVFGKVLG